MYSCTLLFMYAIDYNGIEILVTDLINHAFFLRHVILEYLLEDGLSRLFRGTSFTKLFAQYELWHERQVQLQASFSSFPNRADASFIKRFFFIL